MAKFLSQLMTIGRGSIGGLTLTANQFHQLIIRARTAPVQPNTTPQSDMKMAFSTAQTLWLAATAIARDAWEDYASATPYSGPLGDYTVTGRLMFHAVFDLLFYMNATLGAGMVATSVPPAVPGFALLPSFTVGPPTLGDTGVRLSAAINLGDPDTFMFAQRSIVFGDSRRRFKGPWDSSTNQAVDFLSGVPGDIDFIGLNVDDVIFIRIRGILTDPPHTITKDVIIRAVAVAGV